MFINKQLQLPYKYISRHKYTSWALVNRFYLTISDWYRTPLGNGLPRKMATLSQYSPFTISGRKEAGDWSKRLLICVRMSRWPIRVRVASTRYVSSKSLASALVSLYVREEWNCFVSPGARERKREREGGSVFSMPFFTPRFSRPNQWPLPLAVT